MSGTYRILAINPGSTSTKIAVFENDAQIFKKTIDHAADDLKAFAEVQDQLPYRRNTVERALREAGIAVDGINVFVGRGGGLVPCTGGTYEVTDTLVDHARRGMSGQHPAQLASQICHMLVAAYGGRAFIVNPPDVDEFDEIARISGLKGLYRESRIHALNQKEVALRCCARVGRTYTDSNLIICHIGGGVSVTAHRGGRMVDSNDIINGDGPMMPTRAGSLPAIQVAKLAFSGEYTQKGLIDKLNKTGGWIDHLGTADSMEIEMRIAQGDAYASMVYDATIYQIAKNIGSCACALKGKVDVIVLTGGIARSAIVVRQIEAYAGWIAPIEVLAGEFEMEALAAGALRVMRGEEEPLTYTGTPVWSGFDFDCSVLQN